jgi:hypothetical protein
LNIIKNWDRLKKYSIKNRVNQFAWISTCTNSVHWPIPILPKPNPDGSVTSTPNMENHRPARWEEWLSGTNRHPSPIYAGHVYDMF